MRISELQREFKRYALYERGMKAKSYKSILASLKMLSNFARTEELQYLNINVIKGFLYQGKTEKNWKSQTFRNNWQYLKSFFDWCIKNKLVYKNPVIEIEKPKQDKCLPRCLSTEDAKKVLYHTAWYPWRYELEKYRNEAIIATFIMTGIRLQELLNLEVHDVNLSSGDIMIRKGKGNKDRIVPLHPKLLPILRGYYEKKQALGKPSQHFFTGVKSDKPLTQKDVRRVCKRISIESGVKFTPHMLRHTFAREMIDNDFNLYKLKEMMGHADITTTQRYLAISRQGIKDSLYQTRIF